MFGKRKRYIFAPSKQQKAAEERPLQSEVYTSADIMADNNTNTPVEIGTSEISKNDNLIESLIKPLIDKLGPASTLAVNIGNGLGDIISKGIDRIFDKL